MKKVLIPIFCLFILTGCSKVEYNLIVTNDNKIREEIIIPYENTKNNKKIVNNMMKKQQLAYHSSSLSKDYYYNVNLDESNKQKLLLTYSYDYGTNNIINSEAINSCFYKKDIISSDNKFIVKTENISCLKDEYQQIVDEVTVSIKVPKNYKNVHNNADKVVGNKYIWYFNNDNYETHYIDLEMDQTQPKVKKTQNDNILILVVVCSIGILIVLFISLKSKHNNKI
jgi:hypothetical protein